MVRSFIALLMMTVPSLAWEYQTGGDCVVRHVADKASVVLTYQPRVGEYAIAITTKQPWPKAPAFAMRFEGPRYNTITTNSHTLSEDGNTLTVTDRGFGNVLNGLEFNHVATAVSGDQVIVLALADAAPAIQAFRACTESQQI